MIYKEKKKFKLKSYEKTTLVYFVFSIIWIYSSDRILETLISDQDLINKIQTVKGLIFVTITSLLIYFITRSSTTKEFKLLKDLDSKNSQFKSLIENSSDGFYEYYVDSNEVIMSEELRKLFGLDSRNVTFEKFCSVIDERNLMEVLEQHNSLIGQKNISDNLYFELKDKSSKGYFLKARIIRFDRSEYGTILVGAINNMTKAAVYNEGKFGIEDFVSKVFSMLKVPAFLKDKNNCYVQVNEEYSKYLDTEMSMLLGRRASSFFHTDRFKKYKEDDMEIFSSGKVIVYKEEIKELEAIKEYMVLKIPIFDEFDTVVNILGLIVEITGENFEW